MRRFVTLFALLFLTIPFGLSIAGCGKKTPVTFCNGDSGPIVGQIKTITLAPTVYGISLNAGEFGTTPSATAADCNGGAVTVSTYTWAIRQQDVGLVDIVPTTGRLCAGTWNRNSAGGIPNFTVCTPAARSGTAQVTASSGGASSNALPIFVHPVVTSIIVGAPSTNCSTDLATNCCAFSTVGGTTAPTAQVNFSGNACLSQNVTGQLAARVFAGSGNTLQNITCTQTGTSSSGSPLFAPFVGHVSWSTASTSTSTTTGNSVVTIDENGIATANLPGSTIVNASVSNASSTNGYFSTCPPARIDLSIPNTTPAPPAITVNQNNTQPLVATVVDTNGVTLNGVPITFVSTTPSTLPSGGTSSVTPIFPGSGAITAVCLPPACNNSPLSAVGLFGNGLPVVSNQLVINSPGTNSTLLYAASTNSRQLVAIDLFTSVAGTPVRLPYVPNSMVISTDGTTLFLGSSTELMIVSAASTTVTGEFQATPGNVLAVSPDGTTIVVADPTRQTVSLVSSAGALISSYGGLGTRAQFSPDSGTVYIAAGNQMIVHSSFTGWTAVPLTVNATDVSLATPQVAAFLAGPTTTARGYCPITTVSGAGDAATTSNVFYPDAGLTAPAADRLVATNDGAHILGATLTPSPTFTDVSVTLPQKNLLCPATTTGQQVLGNTLFTSTLPGITASQINGVIAASDSSLAFVTFTGTGGILPSYTPAGGGVGALGAVKLSGTAVAPVSGVFSSDNATFFTGTSGDNLIHLITRSPSGFADTSTLNPQVTTDAGASVTVDLLAQHPRRTS